VIAFASDAYLVINICKDLCHERLADIALAMTITDD
jgi:hypothetical protein